MIILFALTCDFVSTLTKSIGVHLPRTFASAAHSIGLVLYGSLKRKWWKLVIQHYMIENFYGFLIMEIKYFVKELELFF